MNAKRPAEARRKEKAPAGNHSKRSRIPDTLHRNSLDRWWTPADGAERDTLVWALVSDYFDHRTHCRACAASHEPGGLPCPHLQVAVAEVMDWHRARTLLSRAQALRAEQEEAV